MLCETLNQVKIRLADFEFLETCEERYNIAREIFLILANDLDCLNNNQTFKKTVFKKLVDWKYGETSSDYEREIATEFMWIIKAAHDRESPTPMPK